MSEVRREPDESGRSRHSIVRLVLENPISAFNTAAIIFGGGFVYASNENRMQQMNERIIKIEAAGLRDAAIAAAKDDRTAAKFETITRDLGDVKVTVGARKKQCAISSAPYRRGSGEMLNRIWPPRDSWFWTEASEQTQEAYVLSGTPSSHAAIRAFDIGQRPAIASHGEITNHIPARRRDLSLRTKPRSGLITCNGKCSTRRLAIATGKEPPPCTP